jgi:hypothetical protein
LLVDPTFFIQLPQRLADVVEHVEILPKLMKATNELSSYRYAAVIHTKCKSPAAPVEGPREIKQEAWVDFRQ